MSTKSKISKAQWTVFWKNLGVFVALKPSRFLKRYKYSQDVAKLRKIGVDDLIINDIKKKISLYQAPEIQFHRFISFFRRDYESVMVWTGMTTTDEAIKRLFRKFHYNNFDKAEKELGKLFLVYKLNDKGEGRSFEIKYKGKGSINRIQGSAFSGLLSTHHENASYHALPTFKLGQDVVVPLLKQSEGKPIYKFIRFSRNSGKIFVKISVDSPKELNLVKYKIADYFNSYLDTPEDVGDFTKLLNFLKTGVSTNYILIGSNFFDKDFKLSVFPQNNRESNISNYKLYKNHVSSYMKESLGNIISIRIADKNIATRNQIFVIFYTFLTEGIIGAITLGLDDRGLNLKERTTFRKDFMTDFGIPLDRLINLDTVSESEIYRLFLQNLPQKKRRLQLRSESSINIYKQLVAHGLISTSFDSEDKGSYCFNSTCRLRFRRKWNLKFCPACKDIMFSDKKIIVSTLDEKKLSEFIHKSCIGMGFRSERFERKLLGRKIYVTEVRNKDKSVCIIPISKNLNENQVEVLKFRFPNLLLVTSKGDVNELKQSGDDAIDLHIFVQKFLSSEIRFVSQLINKAKRNQLSLVRNDAEQISINLCDAQFYKSKNQIVKNLGAELFEAHNHILMCYVFGNAIWLGANKRGSALPDGVTAFPLTLQKNGCFIWDTKYCETGRIVFGSIQKNKKYVTDGKTNPTIIDNGGLKGFVFISNSNPPNNFSSKFNSVVKGRKLKILFMKSDQVVSIYKHFRDNEQDIHQNSQIKEIFIDSMKSLLFKTKRNKKSFVVSDSELNNLLLDVESKYLAVKTQQLRG